MRKHNWTGGKRRLSSEERALRLETRRITTTALRRGLIQKPLACELCVSSSKIEMHHTDYRKPMEVMWLCKSCHREQHFKENKVILI